MRDALILITVSIATACGGGESADAGTHRDASVADAGHPHDAGAADASIDASAADASATDASAHDSGSTIEDAGPPPITPGAVLARLGECARIGGDYATDADEEETISVCGDDGIVWWQSDLDIDCDGGQSDECMGDPSYLPETSATDSSGDPLDASTLPFVVIPLPSSRFRYGDHDIELGQVALVIYEGRMAWGIFGDEGPRGIIGEGSYALAEELGIDPDPETGGADSGATFVIFTGTDARVTHNEDHDEAIRVGEAAARAYLATP